MIKYWAIAYRTIFHQDNLAVNESTHAYGRLTRPKLTQLLVTDRRFTNNY